jgi:uncharacterized protein (DUF1810 family)
MSDEFQHFLDAQEPVYSQVLSELANGRKETHWMWFVFPQLQGLGHSPTARRFAIESLDQACRYAQHPQLGPRLRECTKLVLRVQGSTASEIFDFPDDLKFHSCMTLFALVAPAEPLFQAALDKYFNGEKDPKTLGLLQS